MKTESQYSVKTEVALGLFDSMSERSKNLAMQLVEQLNRENEYVLVEDNSPWPAVAAQTGTGRANDMNEMQIFENPAFGQMRTLEEDDKVLFCGNDVATALGYNNQRDALSKHCRYVAKRDVPHPQSQGKTIEMSFIPESDVYRLVMRSKLPTAERFSDWVVEEVLPTIRKHGAYATPQTLEKALLDPDFGIQLFQKLKEEMDARREAELNQGMLAIQVRQMERKADYFDAVVSQNLLTSIRDTAKLYGITDAQFVRFLLEHKFLYRGRRGKLLPYATRPDRQLFEVKEVYDPTNNWFGVQTFVTPRGRETFRLLLMGKPESGMWGHPMEEPRQQTEEEANRAEDFWEERAKKEARNRAK